MAERRMFTKRITDDDNFLNLSSSAQALYLHLSMSADDDGFCNQVTSSMFKAHASVQDLQALLENRYIYQFENGVIVIKHWRMANALRKDRYNPTVYRNELAMLGIDEHGSYTMHTNDSTPRLGTVEKRDYSSEASRTKRQEAYRNGDLPNSFSYKMRAAFIGAKCPMCGCAMGVANDDDGILLKNPIPSIQHNKPISKGGTHTIDNISVVCLRCNTYNQDNETGELNNALVRKVWDIIKDTNDVHEYSGVALLVTGMATEDSIDKDSINNNIINVCAQDAHTPNCTQNTSDCTPNCTQDCTHAQYSNGFEIVWKAYPRKINKARAYKAYMARLASGWTSEVLLSAVKAYALECKKDHTPEKYIKHASTFFSADTPFTDYIPKEVVEESDDDLYMFKGE